MNTSKEAIYQKALNDIIETGIGWEWGENFWAVKYAREAIEYASSFKEQDTRPKWKSVKEHGYPEHNLGVLVFIPDEDFHITSGMWDISNKWVLLDEYRKPDCEVTHYMEMPKIPKEYQKEEQENHEMMMFLKKHLPKPAELQKKEQDTDVTWLCDNPECKFCGGTGEIKIDNPTTCKYSYCYHFKNGGMSAMPHREESYTKK